MASKNISFNVKLTVDGKEQLVTATTAVKELQDMVRGAKGRTEELTSAFIHFNQAIEVARNSIKTITDIGNALNEVTAESRSFSAAMRYANTLAGKDEGGFARMKDQVDALAQSIPMTREALANGLYQVISSDMPEDGWMSMLETSARTAVASCADLNRIASVTATLVKNYGLAWEEAGAIQDKIQLTGKVGETTFEEMAQALPRVTASAATLGITVDELMASFATLTGVSGNTAEVATQLSSVLNALIKPSKEAQNIARGMGIEFDAAAIKAAGGFQNFLTQLDGQVKQYAAATGTLSEEVYGRLFGNAEALRASLPITGELAGKYAENVDVMAHDLLKETILHFSKK